LAALMGVMLALWPTAPPAASLAGPEAEALALAGQRRGAILMAVVAAAVFILLIRIRTATFDFKAQTLRIENRGAFGQSPWKRAKPLIRRSAPSCRPWPVAPHKALAATRPIAADLVLAGWHEPR
jgi:hypothetical protein